jgi:glucose/arabinose dehydrogenase
MPSQEFDMKYFPVLITTLTVQSSAVLFAPALAQRSQPPAATTVTAAFDPATLPEQKVGEKITVKTEDLPPPKTGPVVSSRSMVVPLSDQKLRVPDGFAVTAFATGLEHPRRLLVLPNGDVILAEQSKGHLTLLRDEDGDGKADWIQRYNRAVWPQNSAAACQPGCGEWPDWHAQSVTDPK